MALTRKDFEFFAEFCVDEGVSEHGLGTLLLYFSKKNPRFNAIKFRDKVALLRKHQQEIMYGE